MNRLILKRVVSSLALLVFISLLIAHFSANTPLSSADGLPKSQQLIAQNLADGRLMQALYQAEVSAAQFGWNADLARVAGQVWEQLGDMSLAATYWEIAVQSQPEDISLARYLAQAHIDLQQWDKASDSLRHLLQLAPDDNRAHYQLGFLEAVFDPSSASEHLRLAARDLIYRDIAFELLPLISSEKMNAATAMQVGLTLADHDLWPYAEVSFRYAADLGEPFPEALAYIGLAQDRQGKNGNVAIEKAFALAPFNAQVLYLRGLHLRSVFDYVSSLDSFEQAMNADPANPAYAAELSTAYRLIGNLGSAELWLKTAVTLSNNDPRFENLLSAFYADLNNN
jgi:tetratricopeptide (TPR) repeat protein